MAKEMDNMLNILELVILIKSVIIKMGKEKVTIEYYENGNIDEK
jgi:hypothetical protein